MFIKIECINLRPLYAIFVGHFIVLVHERCAAIRIMHLMHLMWCAESAYIDVRRCGHRSVRFIVVVRIAVVSARYV